MAVDQYTDRAQEAIAAAQALAQEREQQIVEPEHLLVALLDAREGVVAPLLERAGADLTALRAETVTAVERLPVVRGASQQHVSQSMRDVLKRAGREAERLNDEYISTEHLLVALVDEPSPARDALAAAASPATGCSTRCRPCAARTASPTRTPRPSTRRSSSTAAT